MLDGVGYNDVDVDNESEEIMHIVLVLSISSVLFKSILKFNKHLEKDY